MRAQVHSQNGDWNSAISDYHAFLAGNEGYASSFLHLLSIHLLPYSCSSFCLFPSSLLTHSRLLSSLSAEELAIHNQQKSEVLERIGDAYMRKFFEDHEDVEQTVLRQKNKKNEGGGKTKASSGSLTARQRAHQAQAQAQALLAQQEGKGEAEAGETIDHEFITDLKHRLDYSRDKNLQVAFKNYLESRTTCHEAKKTIDPRLLDLKEVVNTFLRNHY